MGRTSIPGAKVFPDAALEKGEEAYAAARSLGETALGFAAAGGMALTNAEIGAIDEAEHWIERASIVASTAPSAYRAYMLEAWRGRVHAAAGDVTGTLEHLQRAVRFATEEGRPAARCESLARLAVEAGRLGAKLRDEDVMAEAERAALEAKSLMSVLTGHPPWGAEASAALARIAAARGALDDAAVAARVAFASLEECMTEDLFLDVQLAAGGALIAAGDEEEAGRIQSRLSSLLAMLATRILDEDVRIRWMQGPIGSELASLAGPLAAPSDDSTSINELPLDHRDTALLRLLTEGRTNAEIAQEIRTTEETVVRRLAELFARIGATSRSDATAAAIMGKLV